MSCNSSSVVGISLEGFLLEHELVAQPAVCRVGERIGAWTVTAFLGSGGSAEVYRIEKEANTAEGTTVTAALKILVRDDAAARARFAQEARLLAAASLPSLSRFYGQGEIAGRPYLVIELLEPVDLPQRERDVAAYLLDVCRAVSDLHRAGLIHRDLKPSNIMRRTNGEIVLIDLGLVKDRTKATDPERDVSVISEKIVSAGTPRYAAPEQLVGGCITRATDVHAIGRLADVAFDSNPPRSWRPIIRRATSSIPEERYQSTEELARAIRHRNDGRRFLLAAAMLGVVVLGVSAAISFWRTTIAPTLAWHALCENVTTNLVVRELVCEQLTTNTVGGVKFVAPEHVYQKAVKWRAATLVRLNGRTNEFERPIWLDASREYFIEGPGVLAADLQVEGDASVRVHLKNCFLFNHSTVPIDKAGIRYVFEGGAYLNFVNQDESPRSVVNDHVEGFDGALDVIRFRGPMTRKSLDLGRMSDFLSLSVSLSREKMGVYERRILSCHFA